MATADELTGALTSGVPERVTAAIRELEERRRTFREVPVPFPGVEVLDSVAPVPEELLGAFLRVVSGYLFVPLLDWRQRIEAQVDALLSYGGGQSALDVALNLKTDETPQLAVRTALRHLCRRGAQDTQERDAAVRFVSYLLDTQRCAALLWRRCGLGRPPLPGGHRRSPPGGAVRL